MLVVASVPYEQMYSLQMQDVPKVIPWTKLDHIAYAFAVPDRHGDLAMFDAEQLQQGTIVNSVDSCQKA